jgi:hypothetical protein
MDRLLIVTAAVALTSSGACHKTTPAPADSATTLVRRAIGPETQMPPSARGQFFAPSGMAGFDWPVRIGTDMVDVRYLVIADTLNSTIRKVETSTGLVTTLLGSPGVEGTTSTLFKKPTAIAVGGAPTQQIFVADTGNNTIRICCVDANGAPGSPTIAGVPGTPGYAEGASSLFNGPGGIAIDQVAGFQTTLQVLAIYVADTGNSVIRRLTSVDQYNETTGMWETFWQTELIAGTPGQQGQGFADAATGTAAKFNRPTGLVYDHYRQKLYVADTGNHVIRVVNMAAGANAAVTTLAGSPGQYGHHDGLLTTEARFAQPVSLTLSLEPVHGVWSLLVTDRASYTVRSIDIDPTVAQPRVTTVAGVAWERGFVDGSAATARLRAPSGVAIVGGKTYVLDTGNNLVRSIRPDGQGVFVSTLTGSRKPGSGDGWPGTFSVGNPRTIACNGSQLFVDGIGVNAIDLDADGLGGAARTVASSDWTGFVYLGGALYRNLTYNFEKLDLQTGVRSPTFNVDDALEDGNTSIVAAGTDLYTQFLSAALGKPKLRRWPTVSGGTMQEVTNLETVRPAFGGPPDGWNGMPAWDGAFLYSRVARNDGQFADFKGIIKLDTSTLAETAIAVPGLGNDQISAMAAANGFAYVTTPGRHDIRRINLTSGAVDTLAGSASTADAPFENPSGLCISGGNLFVADTGNGAIRKVDIATAAIVTLALRRAQ